MLTFEKLLLLHMQAALSLTVVREAVPVAEYARSSVAVAGDDQSCCC